MSDGRLDTYREVIAAFLAAAHGGDYRVARGLRFGDIPNVQERRSRRAGSPVNRRPRRKSPR